MPDAETLAAYALRADDYADRFAKGPPDRHLEAFVAALPAAARVLDLGCGPGRAASRMMREGFEVDAWDASPEMARIARDRFGIDVRIAFFDDLDATAVYDGIWANFSLLHAPRAEMPAHLARIARALKPGGFFHLGLKTGTGEARDSLGRFYTFYGEDELDGLLADAGFTVLDRTTGAEKGLGGTTDPFIILRARRND